MSVQNKRALIVDDEADIREVFCITLAKMSIEPVATATLSEALRLLKTQQFDLCFTDMKLPDGEGISLIQYVQKNCSNMPIAMITAFGNVELAVQALKCGAFDFVSKPIDLKGLRDLVEHALRLSEHDLSQKINLLQGNTLAMQELRAKILKLARSQAPIFITGESGTGKELVARLIHQSGSRQAEAFVPVNCGAIPEQLMESEFFGHVKGSFTGAIADKVGLFKAADKGTLFLDEVAELPLNMQVKLLRAIQEKAIKPVGANAEIAVDVRVLSATHENLKELVNAGEFRQDLYYRINVIELTVPSLRDRRDDLPILIQTILKNLCAEQQLAVPHVMPAAEQALLHYDFPGNVRELENILERALTLSDRQTITPEDLQLNQQETTSSAKIITSDNADLGGYLDDIERQQILNALATTKGNKTQAAKVLGITFRALRYRLKKLGI